MKIGQKSSYTQIFTQEDFDLFAKLSGDDNPIHVDPEFSARTKFGNTVAHGMLIYSTIIRFIGEFILEMGMVQASQELMFPNPTFVGQEVTIKLETKKILSTNFAEISTIVAQEDEKMSCLGKTTVWFPGNKEDFSKNVYKIPHYARGVQDYRGLYIGQTAERVRIFEQADLDEYLELIGDANLIFTDRDYAVSRGFKDVLLPGGLLGGLVSDLLGTQLPGRGTNWLKQKYYFLQPSYPRDEIRARVEISRLRPEKDLVNLRTTLRNQNGEIVVDGEALVWVSDLDV